MTCLQCLRVPPQHSRPRARARGLSLLIKTVARAREATYWRHPEAVEAVRALTNRLGKPLNMRKPAFDGHEISARRAAPTDQSESAHWLVKRQSNSAYWDVTFNLDAWKTLYGEPGVVEGPFVLQQQDGDARRHQSTGAADAAKGEAYGYRRSAT